MPPPIEAILICLVYYNMIEVTKINGQPMVLNCDLIESIEAAPDTIVRLTSGKTIVIKESVKELVERVIDFKRRVLSLSVTAPAEAFEEVSDQSRIG